MAKRKSALGNVQAETRSELREADALGDVSVDRPATIEPPPTPAPATPARKSNAGRKSNASKGQPTAEELIQRVTVRVPLEWLDDLEAERNAFNRQAVLDGVGDVIPSESSARAKILLRILERYLAGEKRLSI